jgi:hypothetical protein
MPLPLAWWQAAQFFVNSALPSMAARATYGRRLHNRAMNKDAASCTVPFHGCGDLLPGRFDGAGLPAGQVAQVFAGQQHAAFAFEQDRVGALRLSSVHSAQPPRLYCTRCQATEKELSKELR